MTLFRKSCIYKLFSYSAFLAKQFRDAVITEVAAGRMKVVCNGVSSKILPGLNDTVVRRFNRGPVGPHPVASFEVTNNLYSNYEYFQLDEATQILISLIGIRSYFFKMRRRT